MATQAQMLKAEDAFVVNGKLPPMDEETGSGFGWYDRMFFGYNIENPELVFSYTDWKARDLETFIKKDYKARQIMNVLQLPIESAERSFSANKGDKGEYEWLENFWAADHFSGGCKTPLDHIISQMTSAFGYSNAFFEKVFGRDENGKVIYDKVAFRPQTTCRMLRDVNTASFQGFEQDPYYLNPKANQGKAIVIPKERAFVYLHGARNDPINGVSDMEVPYWCYKTKQKIMLLWFQFLEGVALPRQMVGAQDIGVAQAIAGQIGKLRNSGVLPYSFSGGAQSVKFDTIDASGKGAEQFVTAISWLDGSAVDSVLAGFLNLTGTAAARGFGATGGSYALSKDASDFFLQALESKAKEMAYAMRKDLFAPLIRYNFGKGASIPLFKFEPLNDEDKSSSIALLQAMIAAPPGGTNPVPNEFVSELAEQVANYLGLDGGAIQTAFKKASDDAKAQAAQMSAQMASGPGQAVAGIAGAVNSASTMVNQAQANDNTDSGAVPNTGVHPAVASISNGPAGVTSAHGKTLLKALGVGA